jgi:hypothetical protein
MHRNCKLCNLEIGDEFPFYFKVNCVANYWKIHLFLNLFNY